MDYGLQHEQKICNKNGVTYNSNIFMRVSVKNIDVVNLITHSSIVRDTKYRLILITDVNFDSTCGYNRRNPFPP